MTIEGELTVRLEWDGHRVNRVAVRSTRPFAAARILAGRTPADAAATVPHLFSICGGAQGAAARGALAAAGATEVAVDPGRREHGVVVEMVQEYFWRLLIDWPQAMGGEPATTPVAVARHRVSAAARASDGKLTLGDPATMRALGADLAELARRSLYGIAPEAWLAMDSVGALQAWTARGETAAARLLAEMQAEMPTLGRSDVQLMPPPGREALVGVIVAGLERDPAFAGAPTWNGAPVETGALARVRSHPLVAALLERLGNAVTTRYVARMVELARALVELAGASRPAGAQSWVEEFALEPSVGLGCVQTARGLLLHRARIEGGRVADYRIVAPTEWNFHPDGALARGLLGTVAGDEVILMRQARLAVQALDPCVAFRVEAAHA